MADDVGRAAEQVIAAYGLRVLLRGTDSAALELLLDSMPGDWRQAEKGRGRTAVVFSLVACRREYKLYRDHEELVRTPDLALVRQTLIGFAGRYFGEFSRARTFVHAGVVALNGRAILVAGKQNSGKTTLTAALVEAGAVYLSDEYAPIDDRGRVHPFARPLSFREPGGVSTRLQSIEALGGIQGTRALPVSLVVLAPYTGARRWRPRRLTPGRAALELLNHTVSAQTASQQALERLGAVTTSAPALKGGRGEAADTARLIVRRLRRP